MILGPTGVFAATNWGIKAELNPAAHGFSEVMYQFSSASANNGSGFEGLGDTWGFNANPNPAPTSGLGHSGRIGHAVQPISTYRRADCDGGFPWDQEGGAVWARTMRDDTLTFYFLLLGTIVIIGALLFLPVAALGPLADHLGPIPFGG